jgi:hypothetical protein
MLAVSKGQGGMLKCRSGANGNLVFNLADLLSEKMIGGALSAPGVIDFLTAGNLRGVTVTRLQAMTLISILPPLQADPD